jgi:ketosteroid isomerase-like protein
MSQENVEAVQRAFIAWNTRDFDALIADSASDVEWDFSHVAGWTETTTYRGLPELRSFWDLWLETWTQHHLEPLQVITLRDGKVVRTVVYSDPDEAASAAGIPA